MKTFFVITGIITANIIALVMLLGGILATIIFFGDAGGESLILIGGVIGIVAGVLLTIFLHHRYNGSWFSIFSFLGDINF